MRSLSKKSSHNSQLSPSSQRRTATQAISSGASLGSWGTAAPSRWGRLSTPRYLRARVWAAFMMFADQQIVVEWARGM